MTITSTNAPETGFYTHTAFMSDLGIAPGTDLPRSLPTNLGNGQPFVFTHLEDGAFMYRQALGCLSLVLFND